MPISRDSNTDPRGSVIQVVPLRGLVAMAATVVLWSGFALSIRGIGHSSLTVADVAMIRFVVPVVLLAPWLRRTLRLVRRERPASLVALGVGAGVPYFTLSALGGRLTSAALVGMVIPGTVPVFVAVLSFVLWRAREGRWQVVSLGTVLLGVLVAVVAATTPAMASGILVLLSAGLVWAVYTLGLRRTGLDPVGAALVVCVPSAAVTLVALGSGLAPSHLLAGTAQLSDAGVFLAVQGVGVGVLAAVCYATAVRHLGSRLAATLGAASPVLTALCAVPLLAEIPTMASTASLVLVVLGVVGVNVLPRDTQPERRAGSGSPRCGRARSAPAAVVLTRQTDQERSPA